MKRDPRGGPAVVVPLHRPRRSIPVLWCLLVLFAGAEGALGQAAFPLAPCVHPEQLDDADRNVAHLLADAAELGDAPTVLATLAPERSPHVDRVTFPADLLIASPLVLVNVELVVCGDVWVLPTGSLTLYGATLTVAHPTRGGLLRVLGLEVPTDRFAESGLLVARPLSAVHDDPLIGGALSRLLFTHPERAPVLEGGARPVRISVETAARLDLEGAIVRATTGIEAGSSGPVAIRDSTIVSSDRGLYAFALEGLRVEDTTVTATGDAFYITGSRDVEVRGVTVAADAGVHVTTSTDVRILGSSLTAARHGVYAFDSADVLVAESSVRAVSGVYGATTQGLRVEDTAIEATGTAITLTDSRDAVLHGNLLLGGVPAGGIRGVYLERTRGVLLDGNRAHGFDSGFHILTGEETLATCNVLTGNDRGAYVSTTVDVALRGNDFYGNGLFDLHAFLAPDVDATDNWWGAATGPAPGKIFQGTFSTVVSDPWRASPIACPAAAPDRVPPSVALVRPAPGAVYVFDEEFPLSAGEGRLSNVAMAVGPLTFGASASDAEGAVAYVRFSVDGIEVAVDTTAPYAFTWDPVGPAAGPRTITATAVDAAGNAASASGQVLAHAAIRA